MSLIRILKSRFQKETDEEFVKLRRNICRECPNSTRFKGRNKVRLKIIKAFSDFYSWITMSENDDLYECSFCGCPIFYLTRDKDSKCSGLEYAGEDKWKSIYIPNKK